MDEIKLAHILYKYNMDMLLDNYDDLIADIGQIIEDLDIRRNFYDVCYGVKHDKSVPHQSNLF